MGLLRIVGNVSFCMRFGPYLAHFVLGQVGQVKIVVKMQEIYINKEIPIEIMGDFS